MLDEAVALLGLTIDKRGKGRAPAAVQILDECLALWVALKKQAREQQAAALRESLEAIMGKTSAESPPAVP